MKKLITILLLAFSLQIVGQNLTFNHVYRFTTYKHKNKIENLKWELGLNTNQLKITNNQIVINTNGYYQVDSLVNFDSLITFSQFPVWVKCDSSFLDTVIWQGLPQANDTLTFRYWGVGQGQTNPIYRDSASANIILRTNINGQELNASQFNILITKYKAARIELLNGNQIKQYGR